MKILPPKLIEALHALRRVAEKRKVDIGQLMHDMTSAEASERHSDQMASQTIRVLVNDDAEMQITYSHETGHPAGEARHLSMSVHVPGKFPNPEIVWLVASELGFDGDLSDCVVWRETITARFGDHEAVNLCQPIEGTTTTAH